LQAGYIPNIHSSFTMNNMPVFRMPLNLRGTPRQVVSAVGYHRQFPEDSLTSSDKQTSPRRRLLLASDRGDRSSELADILQSVGEVDTIATSDIPEAPARDL